VQFNGTDWVPSLDNMGAGQQMDYPFIVNGTAVPEPGSVGLMLLGGAGLAYSVIRARRRS
jgi:hypothetical protein